MNSVLEAVVIFPLTAGYIKYKRNGNDVRDGKISSIVVTAALLCVTLTLTLVLGALYHQKSAVPTNILWGIFTCKDFISIICIAALARVLYKNRRSLIERQRDYSIGRKILFLWIFGLGFLLFDGMNIAVNAYCDYIENSNHLLYVFGISTHVIALILTVSELGFITFFSKYRVCSTKLTNYAMFFILASNLADWVKGAVKEIFRKPTTWNGTEFHFHNCYTISPVKNFTKAHLYPILIPAQTEYSLLATLVLLGMMSPRSPSVTNDNTEDDISSTNLDYRDISSTGRETQTSFDECYDSEYNARETDMLIPSINGYVKNRGRLHLRPLSYYVTIGVGLILSLPLLLVTMIKSQTKTLDAYISFNACVTVATFFSISDLIIVWCTFHALRTQCKENESRPISSSEWLLIFSNFGLGIFQTFNISAFILSDNHHTSLDYFLFLRHPIVLINSFFQTILILQANRYGKFRTRNIDPCLRVENCFLLLHILSFMLWFTSIFTTKRLAAAMKDEKDVFGGHVWNIFLRVMWPINIFYGFHSAMDLYGLYKKFDERT